MIVKELDTFVTGDTLARAGRKAEESLSHYLSRAFKTSPDFRVFNGLRLVEKDGDVAQMDHLILHRYGVVIVESKSVSSRVRINEHEEWSRFWNGDWRGMPSPIKQAERQGEFLRGVLQEHREQLRNKLLFGLKQDGFLNMQIDVVVAISDSGLVDRPRGKNTLPEVCKADQVTERVQELNARYKKMEGGLFSIPKDPPYTLSNDEIERISEFLMSRSTPLRSGDEQPKVRESEEAYRPEIVSVAVPAATAATVAVKPISNTQLVRLKCRHCAAEQIEINYGRYGYYLKCGTCDGNTALNRLCGQCGGKEKTRKDGRRFFAECASCATSYAFHENARA